MFFFVKRNFNLNATNLWELLAGLGIFLFGMLLLEEAIKNLSDRTFKKIIHRYTNGRIRSVLAGTFATAILQSSSAVSLMVLAFAGAGIMSMGNAIGVILGSNIGTTLTSWIVATVGFKLNIELLSLPFIGIGGLGLIFLGKSKRGIHFSRLLVGFGFLFMGLDYMKRSFDFLSNDFDVASLPDYGAWFYVLIGFALTALSSVQFSSYGNNSYRGFFRCIIIR
jgi:phosphate:Na+ symporter